MLNDKQRRFTEEYLLDLNATQAAIRAGYSEKTAGQQGFMLLKNPEITAAIAAAQQARSERTLIKADQVLLDINAIAEEARKAGEFGPAIRGKELIGKHYKLFTDQLEVKDTTPRAERLAKARARRQATAE